jgi:putative nucleotidyltransferase with HDIG domain
MKPEASKDPIAVDDLRIGMFVHLDMSWMSHPFPLGSFKITQAEQIATIRSLGVQRLRWSPQQSDPAPDAAAPDAATPGAPTRPGAAESAADAVAVPPAEAPELAFARARRDKLSQQRAALAHCERQFGEAALGCKRVTDLVGARPAEARVQAEALSTALVDKMLGDQELCIRLLSDAAGDKASTHALNVAIVSLLMGRTFGLSEADMLDLGVGALLHDVGKIDLPERVRHNDERLSGSELRYYEEHVARGVVQGRRMGLAAGAQLVIAQHHEHADGSGFPLRLNADRMTVAARIVSLVNRYDNLCNPHLASAAMTPHESVSLLFAQGKTRFDTAILGAFIRMMGVYPAGSTVQLTDDRFAMVVGVNSSRPLKPRVLVAEAGVPRDEALIVDLETAQGLGIRRSLKPSQLPSKALDYLSPRPRIAYFFEPLEGDLPQALAA